MSSKSSDSYWMHLPVGSKLPTGKKTSGKAKYGNKKVNFGGEKFDSKAEWLRWNELQMLQYSGKIRDLRRQVKYHLIPEIMDDEGRVIETAKNYYADFVYTENGKMVVEDVKGFATPEYKLKRHLMLWIHGIRIREIKVGRDI